MIVTRLFLLSEHNLLPSKPTAAFLRTKKTESRIIEELKMNGKMETNRFTFKSEMTANDAIVIPMAKEPVFPTNILPEKLRADRTSQKINGPTMRR